MGSVGEDAGVELMLVGEYGYTIDTPASISVSAKPADDLFLRFSTAPVIGSSVGCDDFLLDLDDLLPVDPEATDEADETSAER